MSNLISLQRRRSREIALQIIYELDLRKDLDATEALALYPFEDENERVVHYASHIVHGVEDHLMEIDHILRQHIVGWRLERIVAVDRAALRMALFECFIDQQIPVAVAISEAVAITKIFGTEESGKFVNGVLGRIVRTTDGSGSNGEDEDLTPPTESQPNC